MSSIRKTKKRLKRQIAEFRSEYDRIGKNPATWLNIFALDAIRFEIERLEEELEKLKRKK